MKKSIWVVLFVLLAATAVFAQTKTTGTLQCGKPDPQLAIPVGDHPGHLLEVEQAKCTWTKPMEIAATATKEGTSTSTAEINGDKIHVSGFHTSTMADGDQIFVSFQGNSATKDGKPVSSEGTWAYTDGTGKLKGIQGKGTFKGAPAADGSMVYQVEGAYKLPKSK